MKKLRNANKKFRLVLLCAALLTACSNPSASPSEVGVSAAATEQTVSTSVIEKVEYDEDDMNTDWNKESSTAIELNGTSASISGLGAAVKDQSIQISAAGTYVLSEKWDDGKSLWMCRMKGSFDWF